MIFKDYYKILGLKSTKVTVDEIKTAYRDMAKKYHPDVNVGDKASEDIFKDINEAYRILSNDKSKRKYDFNWNRYIGRRKSPNTKNERKTIKEILAEIFFGGISKNKIVKDSSPEYGENISTEINISIQDAFYGAKKQIKLRTVEGKETSFTFKVPAGIQNRDKIRIIGQGKPGKNGGKNGDLFIIINIINDQRMSLKGDDLYVELPIQTYEAALGTKKVVKIFEEQITIIIPECTSSGSSFIIKEKGYKNGKGSRGNLYIITKIILPKKLTQNEKKLYNEIREEKNI